MRLEWNAEPKTVMELILLTQYFDTMKSMGEKSRASTIFIPHQPGALKDLGGQIRQVSHKVDEYARLRDTLQHVFA